VPSLNAAARHLSVFFLGLSALWSHSAALAHGSARFTARPELVATVDELTRRIPLRSAEALTGSRFVESVGRMDLRQRERAILQEVIHGNIPNFLRRLAPVTLTSAHGGVTQTATVFVMPDYLAIGSDDDYLRIPMNLETATAVAAQFGFLLPTKRIVNAVYAQSAFHFVPEPLTPGPQMSSTGYYQHHNALIQAQVRAAAVALGALVSGHKKDVVITNMLARTPGRIAIYGWQRPGGTPIQPLSTVHGVCYEDYSHGIRLVSEMAWENGALRSVRDILQDPASAAVLSDEGLIRAVFGSRVQPAATLTTFTPGFCSSGIRDGN
jgi:hypothetical protein